MPVDTRKVPTGRIFDAVATFEGLTGSDFHKFPMISHRLALIFIDFQGLALIVMSVDTGKVPTGRILETVGTFEHPRRGGE